MLNRVRQQLGTAGLVISIIALIAALGGGAYAASQSGRHNQKASSKYVTKAEAIKIAKKHAGKEGKEGPPGPTGPAGQSTKGDKGEPGTAGKQGDQGIEGPVGKSVIATNIPVGGGGCDELGGTELEVEDSGVTEEVCNGAEGEKGDTGNEGSPWTVNGTLPEGKEEKGVWGFAVAAAAPKILVPISFSIPLSGGGEGTKVHWNEDANYGTFCEGTPENPKVKAAAPSLTLCVAEASFSEPFPEFVEILRPNLGAKGMASTGAILEFKATSAGYYTGTWAVKG